MSTLPETCVSHPAPIIGMLFSPSVPSVSHLSPPPTLAGLLETEPYCKTQKKPAMGTGRKGT